MAKDSEDTCNACGRVRRISSKGLCWTCYKKTLKGDCIKCGRYLPIVSKGRCASCARADRVGTCRLCGAEGRLWSGNRCWTCYHHDPEVNSKHKAAVRKSNLKQFYQLTHEQFEERLEAQGYCCAICRRPASEYPRNFSVDHDHACCPGQKTCGACIRGLVCQDCNNLLGQSKEDVSILQAAVRYLSKPRSAGRTVVKEDKEASQVAVEAPAEPDEAAAAQPEDETPEAPEEASTAVEEQA